MKTKVHLQRGFASWLSESPKTDKSPEGYANRILYMEPDRRTCACAGACYAVCLDVSGYAAICPSVRAARIARREWYFADRERATQEVAKEVAAAFTTAVRRKESLAVRLNGTSDLSWRLPTGLETAYTLAAQIAADESERRRGLDFDSLTFYEYTKHRNRMGKRDGVYRVLSHDPETVPEDTCRAALGVGHPVAVVFSAGVELPSALWGFPVIDGDAHDLRFLDREENGIPHGLGYVVGLKAKARAKAEGNGFTLLGDV